jgi:hypothetical protein
MSQATTKAPKRATTTAKAPIANANFQFFNFKKYERKELTQIGTLRSNFGDDAIIKHVPKNWRSDDNIYFVIELADGSSTTMSCSKAVSELLRSQEITIGQAGNLPIILRELTAGPNAGQLRPMITLPASEANQATGMKLGEMDDSEFNADSINSAFNAPAW